MIRKAYSLVEAMVAVSVLTIIISVGVSIIFVSSETENTNKDLLIGTSLAAEGAEAMKSIYYTNILKFGEDDVDECGLLLPGLANIVGNCIDKFKFYKEGEDRYYRLSRNYFKPSSAENDLLTWSLYLPTVGSPLRGVESVVADGLLNDRDSAYRLSINYICEESPCSEDGAIAEIYDIDGDIPTKFYREILTSDLGTSVLISSRVHWATTDGNIRTVENSFELPKNE